MDTLVSELERHLRQKVAGLEENVRILESVLESMGDGVVVVDEQGKFLLFNAAARRIYGRGPVDGPADRWSELYGVFQPDGISPFPADQLPLARALRGESTDQVELSFRNPTHPDGIVVSSTGRPLRDERGHVRGGIVVLRDISLIKESQVELRDTNLRLSHLLAEQAHRAQQLRILGDMSSLLQATTAIDELSAVVADYMERLVPDAEGAFFVYSASRDDLEQKSCWGGFLAQEEAPLIRPHECWGLRRGRAHRVHEPTARMKCLHVPSSIGHSYLCMPVLGPDETIGLLHVRFDTAEVTQAAHPAPVWEEREQITATAAEYVGLALVNLRLRLALQQQSIRDALTGLFNRRFLEETLAQELRRALRKQTCVCVLMLDIDNFKPFNDAHGHAAGDTLLREFGALLKDGIRGGDIAARYGGEEFTIVLPDTAVEDAQRRAKQLLEQIKALHVVFNGGTLGGITASVGISAYPAHGEKPVDVLGAADTALYAAKLAGRDRVEVFTRTGVATV
jgi:diguanylate cyclase (GGDEF)-like protein